MGGGPEQKNNFFFGGGAKFKGRPKIFGGAYEHSKVGHTTPPFLDQPPFSKIPPNFLEIQDGPTFHRSLRKTELLNNSCNQFVYHFYPQSILVLEECLQKW